MLIISAMESIFSVFPLEIKTIHMAVQVRASKGVREPVAKVSIKKNKAVIER